MATPAKIYEFEASPELVFPRWEVTSEVDPRLAGSAAFYNSLMEPYSPGTALKHYKKACLNVRLIKKTQPRYQKIFLRLSDSNLFKPAAYKKRTEHFQDIGLKVEL